MSRMKDYRIFLIEKIMVHFKCESWESAENILEILNANKHSVLIEMWTEEYLLKEGL